MGQNKGKNDLFSGMQPRRRFLLWLYCSFIVLTLFSKSYFCLDGCYWNRESTMIVLQVPFQNSHSHTIKLFEMAFPVYLDGCWQFSHLDEKIKREPLCSVQWQQLLHVEPEPVPPAACSSSCHIRLVGRKQIKENSCKGIDLPNWISEMTAGFLKVIFLFPLKISRSQKRQWARKK